ncbi:MAG: archaetidylserine decarboxylase [Gemmataceae bacterium]|nr:archaetidylserine decarboxylase [Gemmataceae bacterium]MDW8267379.1 archaetidylserine decarboxylase [Gemmataceae bacterium]
MKRSRWAIKLEQFRQAKRIHGGLLLLAVALLGVKLSRVPIPTRRLRSTLYRKVFMKKYPDLIESEADRPIEEYASLNALFTRGIRPECRPIDTRAPHFLSPCDGTVQEIGRLHGDKLLTLKGIEYTLESLLPGIDTAPFENGHVAVVFLSPADCHRVFSPQDAQVEEAVHVPGYRLLVHPPHQRADYPVYTLNERLILRLKTPRGVCLLVLVAGWGVGNIRLPWDRTFRPRSRRLVRKTWSPAPEMRRGDWIATFELGSTVVLLTQPQAGVVPAVTANQRVKYGQPLFTCGG